MIIRTAKPATCFLGIQPGHKHFRDLKEGQQIHPISGVIIYRFSSNLFFANISVLQREIEAALKEDTKAVILDASGIGSMDITAADRLNLLSESLKEKGIRFYVTEHISGLNTQMRKLGLGHLIENGNVRRTIHIALKDIGYNRPYRWKAVWKISSAVHRVSVRTTACRNLYGLLVLMQKQRWSARSYGRSST